MLEISSDAKGLLASQEGLGSMELISSLCSGRSLQVSSEQHVTSPRKIKYKQFWQQEHLPVPI
jgi:hypothetical protein